MQAQTMPTARQTMRRSEAEWKANPKPKAKARIMPAQPTARIIFALAAADILTLAIAFFRIA